MSWNRFIAAGLLCVVASPVFATNTAPQLEIINDGLDAATGNWVWYVRVAPSTSGLNNATTAPTGTPMATELGFQTNAASPVRTATNLKPGDGTTNGFFDTSTPGTTIFGWEDLYQYNSTGNSAAEGLELYIGASSPSLYTLTNAAPKPTTYLHPTTLDTTGGTTPQEGTQLFTALGSGVLDGTSTTSTYTLRNPNLLHGPTVIGSPVAPGPTDSNFTGIDQSSQYLKITTKGPIAPLASSVVNATLQLLGKHGAGSAEGRIAEITTGTNGSNYKGYAGTSSISLKPGDINLDGVVNGLDVGILATNITLTGKNWTQGDFNGDGTVNGLDVGILATNITLTGGAYSKLDVTGTVDPAASASLSLNSSGGDVPEPASIALVGLAVLGGLGLARRKR